MKNYAKTTIGTEARTELHETLALTGAEISVNRLPAGACVPFVHSHKKNEEIYGILEGKGKVIVDNEEIPLDHLALGCEGHADHIQEGNQAAKYQKSYHNCNENLVGNFLA